MRLLAEMFGSLAGWLMFFLGVLLSASVKSIFGMVKGRAGVSGSGG